MTNLTTLCYIEKDDSYLMLHRTTKENDINKEKWIGIGGHFEEDESPVDCLLREVKEETGLTLLSWHFHGVVTFISDRWQTEYMFLYTADEFEGELIDCNEGELEWVPKDRIKDLYLWEGDRLFLKTLMDGEDFGSLKLRYIGDELVEVDGKTVAPQHS